MKRIDSFLILNLILVTVLSYTFYFSHYKLDYFEKNPTLKAKYERFQQLQILSKELHKLENNKNNIEREIASLKSQASDDAADADIINHSSIESYGLARKYFSLVKKSCYQVELEIDCLNNIETIITQFPETIWAGESLIILTELFQRSNRVQQAKELVNILKVDFKEFSSIQAKIGYLEKQVL